MRACWLGFLCLYLLGVLGCGGGEPAPKQTERDTFPLIPMTQQPSEQEALRLCEQAGAEFRRSGNPCPWGKPVVRDAEKFRFIPRGRSGAVDGLTELRKTGFWLGHFDRYKVPAWVAMTWTADDYQRSEWVSLDRPDWEADPNVPPYAQPRHDKYDFSTSRLERGHMARDADLEAWGKQAVKDGTTLSNAVPQLQGLNHSVWLALENEHRDIVTGRIPQIWIISGPIFLPGIPVQTVGDGIGVPHGTYKVIVWQDSAGAMHMRGYLIPMYARDSSDLRQYIVSVDALEEYTGLDFHPELEDAVENPLEAAVPSSVW